MRPSPLSSPLSSHYIHLIDPLRVWALRLKFADILSPTEAVVPVITTIVLIVLPMTVRFKHHRRLRSLRLLQEQRPRRSLLRAQDRARPFEVNRVASINARRKSHRAAGSIIGGGDCIADGSGVDGYAVTPGAVGPCIKNGIWIADWRRSRFRISTGRSTLCSCDESRTCHFQKLSADRSHGCVTGGSGNQCLPRLSQKLALNPNWIRRFRRRLGRRTRLHPRYRRYTCEPITGASSHLVARQS